MGLGSAIGSAIGAVGSIAGGLIGANNAQSVAGMNYEAQKEFAQNGIRWKVEDAKRAGIHPLYALGASTQGYSPTAGTISVQMGKVTGVRTAALKGTLEVVSTYLTKMGRCYLDGLTRTGIPLRIQTPLL